MAVPLPAEAVKRLSSDTVHIEVRPNGLFIPFEPSLNDIEPDLLFDRFIYAISKSAMKNPEQLKDVSLVWDQEWDDLLEGVEGGNEE